MSPNILSAPIGRTATCSSLLNHLCCACCACVLQALDTQVAVPLQPVKDVAVVLMIKALVGVAGCKAG